MSAPKPRLDVDATRDRLLALGCGYAAERLGDLLGEAVRAEIAPRTSSPTRRGPSAPTAVIPGGARRIAAGAGGSRLRRSAPPLFGQVRDVRNGPPDPPSIFIGSATIVAPVGGSSDMSATFSNAGMSFVISATCVAKSFDWPRSIDGVSMPTAPIRREIRNSAPSLPSPGKCSLATAASPRSAVPM